MAVEARHGVAGVAAIGNRNDIFGFRTNSIRSLRAPMIRMRLLTISRSSVATRSFDKTSTESIFACLKMRPVRTRIRGGATNGSKNSDISVDANSPIHQDAHDGNSSSLGEVLATPQTQTPKAGGKTGRRTALVVAGATLYTSFQCLCCHQYAVADDDWDYGGACGPSKWSGVCRNGQKQSPVNISSTRTYGAESLGAMEFLYSSGAPYIKNTGHGTMQVSFADARNVLKVGGKTLQLLQFHFHSPSEHAFDGERYAMEAHLVHRDQATKELAVVGVMLDASEYAMPNKCLAASLAFAPREHGQSVDVPFQLSPGSLLPPIGAKGSRGYVHYRGSLTTPPCSEGVEWFVLDTPLKISSSQVLEFMRFAGDGHSLAFNSRPLQPLGDRPIFKGP